MPETKTTTIESIRRAATFLKGKIERTRVGHCPRSLEIPGTDLYFKFENEQLTGSFKIRGALNKMSLLSEDERKRGVIASSAGNHAQGVAYGAKIFGVQAHIVMPVTTPIVKINATKSYGANVILHGEIYDEAFTYAKQLEKEKGYVFVHPYQDDDVIAGQGTIGLEILEDLPDLDSVVVPIGGGGLCSGVATALKALKPSLRVIGVVSNQAPGMLDLFEGKMRPGQVKPSPVPRRVMATIAEGIAIKVPSPQMFENYISKLVDEVVAVDDVDVARAIVFLLEKAKTVTEGAGAAGVAAVLSGLHSEKPLNLGKKSCVILCGGNIDLNVMEKVIERGLREESRLARLSLLCDDLPGTLNRVTSVMAQQRANILEVLHDRVSPELSLRETRIDVLVETGSQEHIRQIREALTAAGFKVL